MKILIIDDEDYKYKTILNTLNKIIENPNIVRAKSRKSALVTLINNNDNFNLIICDNYLPMFDNDLVNIKPLAKLIVTDIRIRLSLNTPICVCSSDEVENCNYDYFIKFDSFTSLEQQLKLIINDIEEKEIKNLVKTLSTKNRT